MDFKNFLKKRKYEEPAPVSDPSSETGPRGTHTLDRGQETHTNAAGPSGISDSAHTQAGLPERSVSDAKRTRMPVKRRLVDEEHRTDRRAGEPSSFEEIKDSDEPGLSEYALLPPPSREQSSDISSPIRPSQCRRVNEAYSPIAYIPMSDLSSESSASSVPKEPEEDMPKKAKIKTMVEFGEFLSTMQARRKISKSALSDILQTLYENQETLGPDLASAKHATFRTVRNRQLANLPKVKMTVCVEEEGSSEWLFYENCTSLPVKQIRDKKQTIVYVLNYLDLRDVVQLHEKIHELSDTSQIIDFSVDGVPETKSGGISFDILSIQFHGCRNVYTLAILEPTKKGVKIDDDIVLMPLLSEIEESGLSVRWFIGDAPKRCKVRGHLQHNARFSCPYCLAEQVYEGRNHFYPLSSLNAPERTLDFVNKQVSDIEKNPQRRKRDKDKFKGVARRSPLAVLPGFNIIDDIPAEKMHLIDLGVVRRMIALTYKIKGHTEDVGFVQTPVKQLSDKYVQQKVVSECSRRTRPIDFGNFKAEEWRYMYLAFWTLLFDTCPRETRFIWNLTVYILRALMLPDEYYTSVQGTIQGLLRRWYKAFVSAYGEHNCSYNVHVFSHLYRIRELALLTDTSATKFEDNFAILKQCFHGGSCSTGLQALQNAAICVGTGSGHVCEKSIKLSPLRNTSKVDDTLVFTRARKVFKLLKPVSSDLYEGQEIAVEEGLDFNGLDFNDVLCFEITRGVDNVPLRTIKKTDIVGKCIKVGNKLSVITKNMLLE